jgi:hypothetical protein
MFFISPPTILKIPAPLVQQGMAQLEVFRFLDHPHPTAELRPNAITRDSFPMMTAGKKEKFSRPRRYTLAYLSLLP